MNALVALAHQARIGGGVPTGIRTPAARLRHPHPALLAAALLVALAGPAAEARPQAATDAAHAAHRHGASAHPESHDAHAHHRAHGHHAHHGHADDAPPSTGGENDAAHAPHASHVGHTGHAPAQAQPSRAPAASAQHHHGHHDHHHAHHPQADAAQAGPNLPPITDADRAAAFPDLGPHDMAHGGQHGHMDDNPFNVHVRFDRLEWQDTAPDATLAWSAKAWLGRDDGRLWLRSHGARSGGRTEHAELQALWGRPVSPWWDMVAGVRHRSRPGPSRSAAAVGVIGLAPYFFEIEATAFVEEGGHVSAEVEVEYELLFTQDLVLQPSLGFELNGRSDAAQGIGSGLSSAQAGLRLRYEIRREFAPYLGIEWERSFGRTADFARDAGRGHSDARLVAGLRVWF